MPSPSKRATDPARLPPRESAGSSPFVMCLVAWLIPGGGHLLQGQIRKGLVFFVALVVMFASGIAFEGRLFPFQTGEPLVFLASIAQWALGLPRIVANLGGFGNGRVVALTYEYGNTFLIVSGLLNSLIVIDAFDLATGRKPA